LHTSRPSSRPPMSVPTYLRVFMMPRSVRTPFQEVTRSEGSMESLRDRSGVVATTDPQSQLPALVRTYRP
jgi:hypothetical protein